MSYEAMKADIERGVMQDMIEQQRRSITEGWAMARAQVRADEANRRAEVDRVDYWKPASSPRDAIAGALGGSYTVGAGQSAAEVYAQAQQIGVDLAAGLDLRPADVRRFSERYADRINVTNPLAPKCNHMGYVHQLRGDCRVGTWACGGCGAHLPLPDVLHDAAHELAKVWNSLPEIERPRDGLELAEWHERRKAEKARSDAEKARAVEHLAALQRKQEARRHELQATLSDMPGIEAADGLVAVVPAADAPFAKLPRAVRTFEDSKFWNRVEGFTSDPGRGLLTVAGGDHRLGRFGVPLGEV